MNYDYDIHFGYHGRGSIGYPDSHNILDCCDLYPWTTSMEDIVEALSFVKVSRRAPSISYSTGRLSTKLGNTTRYARARTGRGSSSAMIHSVTSCAKGVSRPSAITFFSGGG